MKALTTLCIGGLVLGVVGGLLLGATSPAWSSTLLGGMEAVVRAWTNAFRLIVTPLVLAQLYAAIAAGRVSSGDAGRLGMLVPAVFLGLLLTAAFVTLGAGRWALSLPLFEGASLGAPPVAQAETATAAANGSWVDGFIPSNLFAAAAGTNLLPLMVFALAFALAARRLAEPLQRTLQDLAVATRDTLFVLVEWLLVLAPLVLLAVGLRAGAADGLKVGGGLLAFVGLEIALLLFAILVLYPVTALMGRVPLRRFARAAAPGQFAAIATRSSLATVPILLRSARETLGQPGATAATVIPLAGAMLKLSRAVVGPCKLLFLGYVLGIPIGPGDLVVFLVTILLLSPATVGLPSVTSGGKSLPAYVAVGVPAEYVVLLGTTTAITDVFQTVLNSTSYLSASTLVTRFARRGTAVETPALETAPSSAPEGAVS